MSKKSCETTIGSPVNFFEEKTEGSELIKSVRSSTFPMNLIEYVNYIIHTKWIFRNSVLEMSEQLFFEKNIQDAKNIYVVNFD